MKPEKFIDAMGHLDEKHIDEYLKAQKTKRMPNFIKFASIAASVAVVLSVSLLIWYHGGRPGIPPIDGTHSTEISPPVTKDPNPDMPHVTHKDFKIVSVAAEKKIGNFISGDTSFVVKTEHGTAEDVRTHLYISTAPEYEVLQIAEETFEVFLSGNIADNTVVSLSYVEGGIIDQSWAFQTEGKLSLVGSYPKDGATTASVDTVIELEFSYSSAEGIEDAVTFEPHIDGTWEHAGRIWRFMPSSPLEKDSTYKMYVGNGITAEGKELSKTATVTFSTYEEKPKYQVHPSIITVDGINSYLPDGDITVRYIDSSEVSAGIGRVSVDKFSTYADMIAFSDGSTVYNAENIGDMEFSVDELTDASTVNLTLADSLPQGYYVAKVYADDTSHLFDWIIQVHPLSVYAAVTERDVLVWIAENGELAEGIPVKFLDFEGTTGEDGTLLMEDVTDGSGETRYLYVGDNDTPFVMGSPSFFHNNYPKAYIYTDKVRYKNTDTIKVWGAVPLDLFYDKPDGKFEVILGDETDTAVEVKPDSAGTFQCEIKLENHKEDQKNIYLKYDGTPIGQKFIRIYNYYLKNYNYETVVEKDFAHAGENLEFSVKVTHVSGINVVGKKIYADLDYSSNTEVFATTDSDGIAHFVITPEQYEEKIKDNTSYFGSLKVLNIEIETDNKPETYADRVSIRMYVIQHDTMVERLYDSGMLKAMFYKIDTKGESLLGGGNVDLIEKELTKHSFCGDPVEGNAEFTVCLYKETRYVEKQEYDPFSKTTYPVYAKEKTTVVVSEENISVPFENGEAVLDLSGYVLPEATETERYFISVHTRHVPKDGIGTHFNSTNNKLISNSFVESNAPSHSKAVGYSNYGPVTAGVLDLPEEYHLYTYFLEREDETYDRKKKGDTLSFNLLRYDGEPVEGGKLLCFVYGQSVRSMEITDLSDFSLTLDAKTFPHANIGAAYFKDGIFHRVANSYVSHDPSDHALTVETTPDKEKYSPGDEVTLTVELSAETSDDAPTLEGTAVNISVVNEAALYSYTYNDILNVLHTGTKTKEYFYSSFRDYSLTSGGGGWGGGGGDDGNFIDTVFFGTAVTDKDGRCTVTFTLPEDRVTSYRVTVHAANRELYAGVSVKNIDVASDFFIQPGEVKYTKNTDDLVIPASLITAVPDTAVMNFRLNELDLELNVAASTGNMSFANFGKIPVGDYTVTVTAVSESDPTLTHRITLPVSVKPSTLEITEKHTVDITEKLEFKPSSSPVTMRFFNDETERYERYMDFIDSTVSARYDTVIASTYAATLRERIYGIAGSNYLSTYNNYSVRGSGFVNLSLLEDGDPDAVLTALYMYITGDRSLYGHYGRASSLRPEPEVETAEALLIRAAGGEAVLADLQSVAKDVSDDPYVHALLSLAFAISGDTASAKEMLIPMEENAADGDRALYCTALVFTDRKAAAEELDRLIEESPEETNLGLAASVYMKTGEAQMGDTDSVTVICGDRKETISVCGLTAQTLILTVDEGDTVRFKDATEGMRISYSYQSTFTPKEDDHNVRGLTVTVTEDISVSSEGVIRIELGDISNEGSVKIALPSSLRYDSSYFGISSNIVTSSAKDEDNFIEIPITAVAPGHYILEPVIYTVDGVNYYSDAIEFTVGNGNYDTAVEPMTVTTEVVPGETEVSSETETSVVSGTTE